MNRAPIETMDYGAVLSASLLLAGGVGKILHLGKLPVNTQLSAFYNVATQDDGPNRRIRARVQFMFPK